MRLRTCSIALEVRPSHRAKLVEILRELRGERSSGREGEPGEYPEVLAQLPTCHFLSICVVESADYDPLLVIEANFDGEAGPFWAQLQQLVGETLREALRCCKRPMDDTAELYDLITAVGSRRDPAPFLELHVMRPRAFFHGNRGLPRERILAEAALAEAVQERLGNGGDEWNGKTSEEVRQTVRAGLVTSFPWIARSPKRRVSIRERILEWLDLGAALFAAMFLFIIPGALFAAIIDDGRLAILLAILAIPAGLFLRSYAKPLHGVGTSKSKPLIKIVLAHAFKVIVVLVALYLLSWPIVAGVNVLAGKPTWAEAWSASARQIAWGIAWLVLFILPATLIWLRYLERHDSSQVAPKTDPVMLRQMTELEDWIPQNHMVSVVSFRPQVLRRLIAYIATPLIHRALRAAVHDGYLGSMRTIHCAQWTFVNNGSRLLFLSNYDLSWEAYFDDFIEKAHEGVTAIWSGSVGFPPTTMLIEDGAAHGRAFKRWARHTMSPTRFWVSAYPHLTVDQIERNSRIANGLCKDRLSPQAAANWASDL